MGAMRNCYKYIIYLSLGLAACGGDEGVMWRETGDIRLPDPTWAPAAVAVGTDGTLFVADVSANAAVQVFSRDGVYRGGMGGYGREAGKLATPVDVALGPAGEVFALEFGTRRVSVFGADGRFLRCFGDDALRAPVACAVSDASVYVVDAATSGVAVFDFQGRPMRTLTLPADATPPFDVAAGPEGEVVLLTAETAFFLNPQGTVTKTVPIADGGFRPLAFCLGPKGQLVLLGEKEEEGVREYYLRFIGGDGPPPPDTPVSLTQPAGVAAAPDVIYVADPTRHTIKKYSRGK